MTDSKSLSPVGRAGNVRPMETVERSFHVHRDTGMWDGDKPTDFDDYYPAVAGGFETRREAVGVAAVLERETGDPHHVLYR